MWTITLNYVLEIPDSVVSGNDTYVSFASPLLCGTDIENVPSYNEPALYLKPH